MLAVSQAEVGDRLLPHVTGIIGGSGSALFAADGSVLGVHGLTPEEVAATATSTDPTLIDVPLRRGRLVVRATPYSPYFARSERELLSTVAALTDLALSRAEISDRERQTAAELAAANQAMLEFVAIASHDLRTPVTVIKGFAATLEDDWERIGPEQRRQYLATVHRHAEHLSLIVDDLLTTSRLDAGVVEPSLERVEVAPFLRRLLDDLRSEESAPVEVDADPGLALLADKDHFHRMVTNYLINAFRYGEPPLVVQGVSSNGCVEVRVCDAGPGLPPEFEGRAFEKFSRVDKRHSRDNQGTGLGLAIVRGLARASGGDAWYEPNRPKGSCFVLRFPAAD